MALAGNPWPVERIDEMCTLLAQGKSYGDVAEHMGVGRKAICSRVYRMRALGDARFPASEMRASVRPQRPVPHGFFDKAEQPTEELEQIYGAGRATIARWRKEVGKPGKTQFRAKVVPENFAAIAPTLTLAEGSALFGVDEKLLRRWEAAAGVHMRRIKPTLPAGRLKMDRDNRRDMSRAGLAADYLRRFGPVFRCDQLGKLSEKGTHWARGRYVLTGAEIIDRAERNGWQPDAWRTVPTSTTTEGARA